ncbi:hypothetical protein ACSNOJ_10190 [Streptomyces sp. URMC 128]
MARVKQAEAERLAAIAAAHVDGHAIPQGGVQVIPQVLAGGGAIA